MTTPLGFCLFAVSSVSGAFTFASSQAQQFVHPSKASLVRETCRLFGEGVSVEFSRIGVSKEISDSPWFLTDLVCGEKVTISADFMRKFAAPVSADKCGDVLTASLQIDSLASQASLTCSVTPLWHVSTSARTAMRAPSPTLDKGNVESVLVFAGEQSAKKRKYDEISFEDFLFGSYCTVVEGSLEAKFSFEDEDMFLESLKCPSVAEKSITLNIAMDLVPQVARLDKAAKCERIASAADLGTVCASLRSSVFALGSELKFPVTSMLPEKSLCTMKSIDGSLVRIETSANAVWKVDQVLCAGKQMSKSAEGVANLNQMIVANREDLEIAAARFAGYLTNYKLETSSDPDILSTILSPACMALHVEPRIVVSFTQLCRPL